MAVKIGSINVSGERVDLLVARYGDGSPAVVAQISDGEPYGKLSVFVAGLTLGSGEFAVKTWSENVSLVVVARKSALFVDTGRRHRINSVTAEVWRFRDGLLPA